MRQDLHVDPGGIHDPKPPLGQVVELVEDMGRLFQDAGWKVVRQTGEHEVFFNGDDMEIRGIWHVVAPMTLVRPLLGA